MGRKKPSAPPPELPAGLSEESQALWHSVIARCRTAGRQAMLAEALRARDRAGECVAKVNADGMTSTTPRSGAVHVHPLLAMEERFRRQFLAGFQALGLYSQGTTLAEYEDL
jgi:hypothetical protein